jgi:uncharacterized protein YqjF (DUF2071 family)
VSELLDAPVRQASSTGEVAHRPWALPEGTWVQGQTWNDVLFAHWRAEAAALRLFVPRELELEEHDGVAWLGVVAFRVTALRLHGLPPLPGLSGFGQLNVRTYVTDGARPGVWFFTLRLTNPLVAEGVKRFYRLPAERARVDVSHGLVDADGFHASYGAGTAAAGPFERFVAERYCHYTADGGRLYRAEVHHRPWQLARVTGDVEAHDLGPVALAGEPQLHASPRQDAVVWPLVEL